MVKSVVCSLALAAWMFAVTPALAQSSSPSRARLLSSEFLGCSGDSDRKDLRPAARRLTRDRTVTFLASSAASCGRSARNLRPVWRGESLDLEFELYSPNDSVVMCLCEYWVKFTFDEPAMYLPKVTVNGEDAVLIGNWPKERR